MKNSILTINCSETSIKFSLYESGTPMTQILFGAIESIGTGRKSLYYTETSNLQKKSIDMVDYDEDDPVKFLMNWLEMQEDFKSVSAAGHRIASGKNHTMPVLVTPALLDELKKSSTLSSGYLLAEIALLELFARRYPAIVQIACFETPPDGYIPRRESDIDSRSNEYFLECYGFHGFSFGYLMEELYRIAGKSAAEGKVVLVHLGKRKSLAAFKTGISIDESVDFTAEDNLPAGLYNGQQTFISKRQFRGKPWWLATQASPNTGATGTNEKITGPMRFQEALLHNEEDIEGFCYETRKWIGAFAAALGGIDTLLFSGGIGEHAPNVRSEVCDTLAFLGIELNEVKNMKNEKLISADTSAVAVRVVQTNEELMIARMVAEILDY